ncbi:MAG: glycosyltransferase [Planctomycetes bacterium]|nr:glycosyltransferase [Planctomycetota bacterium]
MSAKCRLVGFLEANGAGGAEHIYLEYLSALQERGWDVRVIAGGDPNPHLLPKWRLWGPDLEIESVKWASRNAYRFPVIVPSIDPWKVGGLKKRLKALDPDLVLVNQPGPDDAQGAVRASAALRPKVPISALRRLAGEPSFPAALECCIMDSLNI